MSNSDQRTILAAVGIAWMLGALNQIIFKSSAKVLLDSAEFTELHEEDDLYVLSMDRLHSDLEFAARRSGCA